MIINRDRPVDRTGNSFCGPLVIAAILGKSTGEAAAEVRWRVNRSCYRQAVKGMYTDDLVFVLQANGFACTKLPVRQSYVANRGNWGGQWMSHDWADFVMGTGGGMRDRASPAPFTPVKRVGPTLASWLAERGDKAATYVIAFGDHFALVSGKKFVDTKTRGEWVNTGDAPWRRKRVQAVYRVDCAAPVAPPLALRTAEQSDKLASPTDNNRTRCAVTVMPWWRFYVVATDNWNEPVRGYDSVWAAHKLADKLNTDFRTSKYVVHEGDPRKFAPVKTA